MKIGYPCINNSLDCSSNSTFRLSNYSKENLILKIENNLNCLQKILEFNVQNNLLFHRIGSGLIPFASHPVCRYDWEKKFNPKLKEIGCFARNNNLRISVHPDQFVVLNSLNKDIVKKSVKEIEYHCSVLDSMGLDKEAKIQIHIGGVYGDKEASKKRFIEKYSNLKEKIKKRLVIENDHVSYSLKDCLDVHSKTGIPVVFDCYHHEILNNGESIKDSIEQASKTWKKNDGKLMVDYSEKSLTGRIGAHSDSITISVFKNFLKQTKGFDFDVMLEIKDKEKSALKAIKVDDSRIIKNKKQ